MTTRNELLRAAAAVVATSGSRALTLDAVAAKARVSKGGLLYHFPNKRLLIAAMVEQLVSTLRSTLESALAEGQDWLSAYVEATLADVDSGTSISGVLSALAEEPALLEPFRKALEGWYRYALGHYGNGVLPLLLALDGLWFHSQIGTLPVLDHTGYLTSLRKLAQSLGRSREGASGLNLFGNVH